MSLMCQTLKNLEQRLQVHQQIQMDEERIMQTVSPRSILPYQGTQEIEAAEQQSVQSMPRPTHSKASLNIERKLEEKQELLKDWVQKTRGLAWMHQRSYSHFRMVALLIMVPTILLSTLSGATNLIFSNQGSCEDRQSQIVPSALATGIVSLLSAALSTIYQLLDLASRQKDHQDAATDFEKLQRQITVQLLLNDTDERTYSSLAEFIKSAREKYDQLTDAMPHVPAFVVREYHRRTQKKGKSLSEIVISEAASSMRLELQ